MIAASQFKPVLVSLMRAAPRSVLGAGRIFRVEDRLTNALCQEALVRLAGEDDRKVERLAESLLTHAPLKDRQRAALGRELGRSRLHEQDYEAASERLSSALDLRPSDTEAAQLLLETAIDAPDPHLVETTLLRVRAGDLHPPTLHAALTSLADAGRWRAVLAALENHELWEATLEHVDVLARHQAPAVVRATIRDVIHEQLATARIWEERARRLEDEGNIEAALDAYQQALERPNATPECSYRAGRLHLRTGDPGRAAAHLAEAVRQRPGRGRWHYDLGRAYAQLENYDAAVEVFTQAVRLNENRARYANALARARRYAAPRAAAQFLPNVAPPTAEELRNVEVGIVAPVTHETVVVVGWILDRPGTKPRVEIEVNGVPVAEARAVTSTELADGRVYLAFQRTIRELWSFLGKGDIVQVTVDGKALPILGAGDRIVVDRDRPSCVVGLQDKLDRGYVVNKYGRVRRSIRLDHRWQDLVVDLYDELRAEVREAIGAELFPFYGTLLGAIRDRDFLGHDSDFDTAYISEGSTPDEVHAEFRDLCYHLIDRGYRIHARAWHAWVRIPGTRKRLDISICWFDERGRFQPGYGYHGPPVERSEAFRVDRVAELQGHTFLVPSNAEELLAQLYGDGWRQPDPGFSHKSDTRIQNRRYRVPPDLRNEVYWRQFGPEGRTPRGTAFAEWVAAHVPPPATVIEFGCAAGHLSIELASRGYDVHASDHSQPSLERAIETQAKASPPKSATFHRVDVADPEAVARFLDATTRGLPPGRRLIVLLSFGLHALSASGQDEFFETLSRSIDRDAALCLEVQTLPNRSFDDLSRENYRLLIDHEDLTEQLTTRWGFGIEHAETIAGNSPFRDDPFRARIIARRSTG